MADKQLLVDDVTGKFKKGGTPSGLAPEDQEFDVGVGGQSQFVLSNTFDAGTTIDVYIGLRGPHREGATDDFQRNVPSNRIDFNYTVPEGAYVMIRLWL